jgi:hypothetical protein
MVLWRIIWFRYAAYGVARAVGEARRCLVSPIFYNVIGLAAVGGAGMSLGYMKTCSTWLDHKQPCPFNPWTFVGWTFVAEVAVSTVCSG